MIKFVDVFIFEWVNLQLVQLIVYWLDVFTKCQWNVRKNNFINGKLSKTQKLAQNTSNFQKSCSCLLMECVKIPNECRFNLYRFLKNKLAFSSQEQLSFNYCFTKINKCWRLKNWALGITRKLGRYCDGLQEYAHTPGRDTYFNHAFNIFEIKG